MDRLSHLLNQSLIARKKWLVLDDEAAYLNFYKILLKPFPIEIDYATSMKDGLELFQRKNHAVILSDTQMENDSSGLILKEQVERMSKKVLFVLTSSSSSDYVSLSTIEEFVPKFELHRLLLKLRDSWTSTESKEDSPEHKPKRKVSPLKCHAG